MRQITNVQELKMAIQELEAEQLQEFDILTNDIKMIINNLTPYHFIKWTFIDLTKKMNSTGRLTGLMMGLGAGYLAKALNITNLLMELEISTIVAQNADKIIGYLVKAFNFFRKK
jgi:hypothetical protein